MDSHFKPRKQFRQLGIVEVLADAFGKDTGGGGGFRGVFVVTLKNARNSRVGEVLLGGAFDPQNRTVRLNQTSKKPRFFSSAFVLLDAGFYSLLETGDFQRVLSGSRVSKTCDPVLASLALNIHAHLSRSG